MSELVFLLDENVSAKTVKRLKEKKFQIKSVKTEKILGAKNGEILSLCKKNKWVLITHDQDFLTPDLKDHYGIILVKIHPATDSVSGIVLENFLKTIDDSKVVGKIIIVEKNSWRYKV